MHGYPDKKEILEDSRESIEMVANFFTKISPDKFFSKSDGWSAAENLVHLHKSLLPVSISLITPKVILRTMFGSATTVNEDLGTLKEQYFNKLQSGQKSGIFSPQSISEQKKNEEGKKNLLLKWDKTGREYLQRISRWKEDELDTVNLPHPILGNISVRQIICFMVFHNDHHIANVSNKLK